MTAWNEERDRHADAWRMQTRMNRVLYQSDSDFQSITLFENDLYGKVLALDGVIQTTERDEFFYHEMLVHPSLFQHGAAQDVLIIGGGDGGTLEEVLKHRTVRRATMVEIDPAVVEFSKQHLTAICGAAFEDPRTDLVFADGAAWAAAAKDDSDRRYDIILIDSTDNFGPGAALFAESFFADCAALLRPGGLMACHNSVPFTEPDGFAEPARALKRAVGATVHYRVAVPSYWGGDMVMAMAARRAEDLAIDPPALSNRHAQAGIAAQYYTPDIHAGAFALPPYLKALLD